MGHFFVQGRFVWRLTGIACGILLAAGCQKPVADSGKSASVAPSKTTHPVSEASLNTIELTGDAVRRLGLETQPVVMRAMSRMQSYGADLLLPNGASIIVSSPLPSPERLMFRTAVRFLKSVSV